MSSYNEIAEEYRRRKNGRQAAPAETSPGAYDQVAAQYQKMLNGPTQNPQDSYNAVAEEYRRRRAAEAPRQINGMANAMQQAAQEAPDFQQQIDDLNSQLVNGVKTIRDANGQLVNVPLTEEDEQALKQQIAELRRQQAPMQSSLTDTVNALLETVNSAKKPDEMGLQFRGKESQEDEFLRYQERFGRGKPGSDWQDKLAGGELEDKISVGKHIAQNAYEQALKTDYADLQGDTEFREQLQKQIEEIQNARGTVADGSDSANLADEYLRRLQTLDNIYQNRSDFLGAFENESSFNAYRDMNKRLNQWAAQGKDNDSFYQRVSGQYLMAKNDRDAAEERLRLLRSEINNEGYWDDDGYHEYTMQEMQKRRDELDRLEAEQQKLNEKTAYLGYLANYAKEIRYADISKKEDYAKNVQAGKDTLERYLQDAQTGVTQEYDGHGNALANSLGSAEDYYERKMPSEDWTEEEKNIYFYLLGKNPNDPTEAFDYAVETNFAHANKTANEKLASTKEAGLNADSWVEGVGQDVLGMAGHVATSPLGLVDMAGNYWQYLKYGEVMPRSDPSWRDYVNTYNSANQQRINEAYGTLSGDFGPLEGKGFGDLLQTGNSVAESVAWMGVSKAVMAAGGSETLAKAITNLAFFGNAADQTTHEALRKGATSEQALLLGTLAGAAEAAGETFSIDRLINMKDPETLRQALMNILVQSGVEASEEAFTTVLNTYADALVMRDKSELNQKIERYMASGMTRSEAEKKAWGEWVGDVSVDALGGFISGGISSGLTMTATNIQNLTEEAKSKAHSKEATNLILRLEVCQNNEQYLQVLDEIAADKKQNQLFAEIYTPAGKPNLDLARQAADEIRAELAEQEKAGEERIAAPPAEARNDMGAEAPQTPQSEANPLADTVLRQTRQNGAGEEIESGEQMTQPQGQENPAVPSPELNSQTEGQAPTAPSQVNIDNAAEQGYNTSIRETEGISDDQGRSADEAERGVASGEGSLGTSAQLGQRPGESSGVHGIVRLSDSTAKAYETSGVAHQDMQDWSDDGAAYSSALDAARKADPVNGWAVTPQSAEDLQGKKLYMTPDQSAGVVVTSDGDIEGVFRNKQTGQRGALDTLLPLAVENGGTKLDCYGDLVHQYARYGFIPVARVAFNEEYANEGWDPSKGTPDVYIMVYDGKPAAQMIENKKSGNYHKYTQEELDALPQFDKDGYDDAIAYRDNLLAERNNNQPGGVEGGALTTAQETSPQTAEQTALAERGPQEMGEPQPAQKRSQTESNTLQHIADVTGGEQEKLYYTPKSERESLTAALNRVRSDMNGEMQKLLDKEMWTGEDIDTGLTIMGLLQMDAVRTGDNTAAQAWARAVQEHGTRSGQALQAFSKWTRSGVAAATQSMQALEEAKNLTEEDKTRITNDVYKFAEEYDGIEDGDFSSIRELIKKQAKYRNTWTFGKGQFEKMLNEVKDFDWLKEYAMRQMMNISADFTEDADLGQKVKTWQVNAQLSRLGTFFRNIGGNGVFGVQDTLSQDFFGVALDALVGKATGKRTVALDKGWLSSEARKGARQGLVRSILEVAGDVDMGEGGSKYGQGANRTFKMTGNGFDRMMSRWEQLLGYSLTSSDRTFRGGIEAEQLRGLEGFENLTDEERQALAENMADYRLFQNKGAVASGMKGLHDAANRFLGFGGTVQGKMRQGGFGIGDLLMPYPGVPANLWAKALEYSPANVAKGTVQLIKLLSDIKNGKNWSVTQQQNAVMNVARGLHGTALIAGLAALFRAGLFKNADDEDDLDAKALANAEGRQGVQINLSAAMRWAKGEGRDWRKGDKLMKIDWLEPMNAFLAIASLAADDLDNPGAYMLDTLEGSVQAMLDMPVMQSISNIYDSYRYSKADTTSGKLAETGANFVIDSLTGMLPAPVAQTARAMDPYYRDTTGDTAAETALNRVMNAIPGLRQKLPEKLDNFGNPKEQPESAYDRWMNSFVRPGAITDYKADDMYQALDEMYERTGDADLYPSRKAPGSIGSGEDKITLDSDEKRLYQSVYGRTAEQYYSSILLDPANANMSDEDRTWLLGEAQDYAAYKAQQMIYASRGVSKENKDMQHTDNVLLTGVDFADYMLGKRDANEDGEGSLKAQEIYNWLAGSDYTDRQKRAIWDANKGSNKKSWAEYYDANPVTALTNAGMTQTGANKLIGKIDANGNGSMTQEEIWNYYKANPDSEQVLQALWDSQFTGSWADYKRKHSK